MDMKERNQLQEKKNVLTRSVEHMEDEINKIDWLLETVPITE